MFIQAKISFIQISSNEKKTFEIIKPAIILSL